MRDRVGIGWATLMMCGFLPLALIGLPVLAQELPVPGIAAEVESNGSLVPTTYVDGDTKDLTADLAKRVAELEKSLKKRDDADKKVSDAAAKKFVVRPFGRLHVDAGTFSQDQANKKQVGDAENGMDIRRLRMGLEGEGFDIFFYRVDVDFVTFDAATKTRPTVFDAYLDTQQLPVIGNLRVGHFREPFSLERLGSTNDLPFMERSNAVNTLSPFRNLGVMAFDWNESETATWAYGVFNENTNEFGEDMHDRTGVAGTGRATWLPWYDEEAEGRYLLHLGASYSYRRLGNNKERSFGVTPETIIKQGSTSGFTRTPNFVDTGSLLMSDYHVAGCEFATVLGSFCLQGEYIFLAGQAASVKAVPKKFSQNVLLHGGYVEATYWLTGENRNYLRKQGIFGAVTPHTNFFSVKTDEGRQTGSGAWELATRVSTLDLNDANIKGGQLTDVSVGLNWYYAVRSRVMFDYTHAFLNRNTLKGDPNNIIRGNADIFGVRFQYVF